VKRIGLNYALDLVLRKHKLRFLVYGLLFFVFLGPKMGLVVLLGVFALVVVGLTFSVQCTCDNIVNPYGDNFCSNCGKEVPYELKPPMRGRPA